MKTLRTCLIILLFVPLSFSAGVRKKITATLKAGDGREGDQFAQAVAMDAGTIVAGAPFALIGKNTTQGAVYVFQGNKQVAKLTASDGVVGSELGSSVAISGNTIVAAATKDPNPAAYVFVEPAGGWADATETARLGVTSAHHVAISGNTIAVDVAVFVQPISGWVSTSQPNASLIRGSVNSVAISDDTTTVITGGGTISVFTMPVGGWQGMVNATAVLSVPGRYGCGLGITAISIAGNTIAGGCPNWNNYTGAIELFVEPAGGWVNAYPTARLTGAPKNSRLGWSLAMRDGAIVAGAPWATVGVNEDRGLALVYLEPQNGWQQTGKPDYKLIGHGVGDTEAWSVGTSQGHYVVGWPTDQIGKKQSQGAAFVY